MAIAIIDSNILVYLFDYLFIVDERKCYRVIEYMLLKYNELWIPKTVKDEFLCIKKRKRIKWLEKIMNKYELIKDCPFTISKIEIDLLLSERIDPGEADGMMQTKKAPNYREFSLRTDFFTFMSDDKNALEGAGEFGLETYSYNELREEVREMGIEI